MVPPPKIPQQQSSKSVVITKNPETGLTGVHVGLLGLIVVLALAYLDVKFENLDLNRQLSTSKTYSGDRESDQSPNGHPFYQFMAPQVPAEWASSRGPRGYDGNEVQLTIHQPPPGSMVDTKFTLVGHTSDPDARLWVVVHPKLTDDYLVVADAEADPDGSFSADITLPRGNTRRDTCTYKVKLLTEPMIPLTVDANLDSWPPAFCESLERQFRVAWGEHGPNHR